MYFGSKFFFVCLVVFVAYTESLPHRVHNKGKEKGRRHVSKHHNSTVVRGQRRFIGAITMAWSAFNNIADFAGRVNNVDAFITNVKGWIGIGSEPPAPATAEQVEEIKQQITELENSIQDLKTNMLVGAEWGYVLSVLGERIAELKTLVTHEEDYLKTVKSDSVSAEIKKAKQDRFFIEQVLGGNGCKVSAIRDGLTTVQNGIVSGTGNLHEPLYEAYAEKIGNQKTGTVFDLVAFVTYIQELQIHTYAILKNSVDFLEKTPAEKAIEITLYDHDIANVKPAQVPRIAKALNTIVDLRGTSAWGLIKVAGSSKCLHSKPHPGGANFPPFAAVANCPSSPGRDFMWKLDGDNYLINEAASDSHAYLNYKIPNDPRVSPESSRNILLNTEDKRGEHCPGGPSDCDKLTFEYATTDFTYFQIKLRSRRDCIGWVTSGYRNELAKIRSCGSINSPEKNYSGVRDMTWFVWEPKKQ